MWRGIKLVALIALVVLGLLYLPIARQGAPSEAQQNSHPEAQQNAHADKESEFCPGSKSFVYEVEGKRYALPLEVIDDHLVAEGDIVVGETADLPKGGAGNVVPAVPGFVLGQPKRWANNTVPYAIDSSVSNSDRDLIEKAISEWARATNVRFEKSSGTREHYVKFSGQEKFCTSNSLGVKERWPDKSDEKDNINVVQVGGCHSWGSIAHEIGHVLGLGHEHTRSDRDYYVTILWRNIQDPVRFCRATWRQQALADIPYDYDSIMHDSVDQSVKPSSDCETTDYEGQQRCLAFAPNREELQRQEQEQGTIAIGQRDHLSKGDIDAVNTLYPRSSPSPSAPPSEAGQPCVVSTTTTVTVGGRSMTTTKYVPCRPDGRQIVAASSPVRARCCEGRWGTRWGIDRVCPERCRPDVRVSWPRPDRWCRLGWCRRPPPPLCNGAMAGSWERAPFDDGW
jgi:hypothetical protein